MVEVNGASVSSPSLSQSQSQAQATQSQTMNPSTPPSQNQTQSQTQTTVATSSSAPASAPAPIHNLPSTSLTDTGSATRPRDARALHLVLAAKGVSAYQERVPLQLLDFAYRYTSGILSDAQHLNAEGYVGTDGSGTGPSGGGGRARVARNNVSDEITLSGIRMAAASRLGYQFAGALPKEQMLELANERNRIKLPAVDKEAVRFGVRLPPERFVLSGQGWQIPKEWDDEMDSDEETEPHANGVHKTNGDGAHPTADTAKNEDDEEMVDEGEGTYEDVFGEEGADQDQMEA